MDHPATISEGANWGADWGPDDTIVQGSGQGLWAVPASGGSRTQLTTVSELENSHGRPKFLPNGRAVLFYFASPIASEHHVAVYDFGTGERKILVAGASPQYAVSGHLLFSRDDVLWAVPFDSDALEVHGDPIPVVEGIQTNQFGWAEYTVDPDGTLLYVPGIAESGQRSLVWVDRNGVEESIGMAPRDFESATLSPDGNQLVVSVGSFLEGGDLYRYDLERDVEEQVTFSGSDLRPLWSQDGSQIAFSSARDGPANLYLIAADGTGTPTRLTESPGLQTVSGWSPDGETLLAGEFDDVTLTDNRDPSDRIWRTNRETAPDCRQRIWRGDLAKRSLDGLPFPRIRRGPDLRPAVS